MNADMEIRNRRMTLKLEARILLDQLNNSLANSRTGTDVC